MISARPKRSVRTAFWFTVVVASLLRLEAAAEPPGKPSKPPAGSAALSVGQVREAEETLSRLGYWTGPVDGRLDEASRQALIAFQKADWRKVDGRLSARELGVLRRARPIVPREVGTVPHLEADLARQILFRVDADGRISHALPISSGNGKLFHAPGFSAMAETPCGRFTVFQKISGWRKSPLGEMHNPMYLVGGIAIHGSPSVPFRPASHGCIRIPMSASRSLPKLVPLETPVLVYGCKADPP
jgi:hypothetical protein